MQSKIDKAATALTYVLGLALAVGIVLSFTGRYFGIDEATLLSIQVVTGVLLFVCIAFFVYVCYFVFHEIFENNKFD